MSLRTGCGATPCGIGATSVMTDVRGHYRTRSGPGTLKARLRGEKSLAFERVES